MRELARRTAGSPVLVLATYRDVEADASGPLARALADLRRDRLLDRIGLAGLDTPETAALVAARVGQQAPDVALAERLCEQTGGNPFFIEELMRSLAEAPEAAARVPEGVKEVIGGRLDRLPPPALEALTLAAVLGTDFRLSALRIVANELEFDELIASLEAAVAARVVVEDPEEVDRFSFVHALVRETLYERPITSRRFRSAPSSGAGTRGSAVPSAPGRAGASLLPGAACRWRREGRRAQPESSRGGAGRSCLRGRGGAIRARAGGAGDRRGRRRRCALRRDAGAGRRALAGEPARPQLDVYAGDRAGARARLGGPAGTGGAGSGRALLCSRRDRSPRDRVVRRGARRTSAGRQRAARAAAGTPGREPRVRRTQVARPRAGRRGGRHGAAAR